MTDWDDNAADWYARNYGDDPSVFAVVRAARVPEGAAVVDIGCGTGSALRALAGRAGALTGVDPTARMIHHARAQSDGSITYHVAPAEALPLPDGSQDIALAINAVHHWSDPGAGLAEAFRVLRPGGRLVIGGESFGEAMVPEGQDYAAALRATGFVAIETSGFDGGFATSATKPGQG